MSFFDRIKHLFFPPIKNSREGDEKLITRLKLRKELKVGSDIVVSEGHKLVTTYYNTVCDVLESGTATVCDRNMPLLFRCNQRRALRKGQERLKTVKADMYFVSEKEAKDLFFSSSESVPLYTDQTPIKAKLSGQFSFKIIDCHRLMRHLLSDHATVRLYTLYREVISLMGDAITHVFYDKKYSLKEVLKQDAPIIGDWLRALHILEDWVGVQVTAIRIYDMTCSKKYQKMLEDARVSVRVEDELLHQAEQTLSGEMEQVPVYASSVIEQEPSHQDAPFVINEMHESSPPTFDAYSPTEQDAPHVLDELPPSVIEDNSEDKTKICPSCGNENTADATKCTTCGSEF